VHSSPLATGPSSASALQARSASSRADDHLRLRWARPPQLRFTSFHLVSIFFCCIKLKFVHLAGRAYRDYRQAAARYPRWSAIEALSSANQVVDMYRDRQALDIVLDIARDRQALHIALDIVISGTTYLTPTAVRTFYIDF
jgi:hypothetical protein